MLQAQTIAEVVLYLKATGCQRCGRAVQFPPEVLTQRSDLSRITVPTTCLSCGFGSILEFQIQHGKLPMPNARPPVVNPTERPSSLIDLGQWLTLARTLIEEAKATNDRQQARFLHLQAAQCFDEALKFYDDPDNELAPAEAFFTESSRRRFLEAPQQFSRARLLGEKTKLPTMYNPGGSTSRKPPLHGETSTS